LEVSLSELILNLSCAGFFLSIVVAVMNNPNMTVYDMSYLILLAGNVCLAMLFHFLVREMTKL